MRKFIAGIIPSNVPNSFLLQCGIHYLWRSDAPKEVVFKFKKTVLGGWGLKDQKIIYPKEIYKCTFDFLWNYRKTPSQPVLRNPDKREYRIVETDDGKWFATGDYNDLHAHLIGKFNIPLERLKSGLVFEHGDIRDEGSYSMVAELYDNFYQFFRYLHALSCIWAVEHGLEPHVFHGWRDFYGVEEILTDEGSDWKIRYRYVASSKDFKDGSVLSI